MSSFVVRRLLIDLQEPFAHDWCGGDAFSTAFFNALSMSFPIGEQFFIDAVHDALPALSAREQLRRQAEVRSFIGQEATHRRVHGLFNAQLASQGLVDRWTPRARRRARQLRGADPRHALAITAATEHFTAMFAHWLLTHPQVLAGAEARLQTMWLWHSAEEVEHKSVAFELYTAAGGSHAWRARWMRRLTPFFLSDLARQTVANLRHEGQLWKWATWVSAWRLLGARGGLLRSSWGSWRRYFDPSFHPSEQDDALGERWLADHSDRFAPVGGR